MALDLDPGKGARGNPRLIEAILAEMDGGALPFERFMALALYHPEHGYYTKPGRIGTNGDFLTSPAIHPIFGWVVAAWCRWAWEAADRPAEFTIVEAGAGEGALATAILDWAQGREDGFAGCIRYVGVEQGARGGDQRVEWRDGLPGGFAHGVVLANELVDAFPVRLFEPTERGPVEVYVRWNGERFEETGGPVAQVDGAPGGARFEVNQQLDPSARALAGLIGRGGILLFDYGYPREELWAEWRKDGTLLAFHRHMVGADLYDRVGEQDLTAHVDFSALEEALEGAGMDVHGPVSQMEFLLACGIGGLVEAARADMTEYFVRRRAVEQLTDGGGLGRIRVMAGLRGIDATPPGFEAVDA